MTRMDSRALLTRIRVAASRLAPAQERMKWWRPCERERLTSPSTRSRITVPQRITRSRRKTERSAMKHVAIDLGARESQICIRDADGTILQEGKEPTKKLLALMATWEPRRVILETSA